MPRTIPRKDLLATIAGYDAGKQQDQLQLHPDQLKPPPPSATTPMGPLWVALSKVDVRMVQPGVADVPPAAPAVSPTPAHTECVVP